MLGRFLFKTCSIHSPPLLFMSSRRICLSLLIVVCSLLVNCGTTKGPHSSNLTPPTAYFFGLEDQKAVYGVGALNDIGPDRDDAHFSTLTIRFIGPDSGKWAIQVMIDGYRLREWPNKHPQSCGPVLPLTGASRVI